MRSAELLADGFQRIHDVVHRAVDGLTGEQLRFRVDSEANTIGWLIWHLTRIQDDHIADAAGLEQVWLAAGWQERFALPLRPRDTGYGHSAELVGSVRASAELLLGYHDAVHEQTVDYLDSITDDDLARIVDTSWDPPVTLAVRLVSVLSDDLQHAGQAAFVRGIAERSS